MSPAEQTYLKTKRQAARFLNVSVPLVERLMKAGVLRYVKVNEMVRFTPEDLRAYIEANSRGGQAA